ncbi:hypothetical protein JMUB6875_28530 [Nocardia sp. JMUB6875]|uniref:hypothetical protein n=1 Tax=Nocardia sp. JMUB6875 TaxID=3158170 RepID=UPI0032E7E1D7
MRRLSILVLAALLLPITAAPAQADPPERTERVVQTGDGLIVSEVTRYAPLPPSAARHSPACDYITYLRYRLADGPEDPQQADTVIIGQPAALMAGYSLDGLARNLEHQLRDTGKKAEFWAVHPRNICMFDRTGLQAANDARDYHLAWDYYFEGKEIDGKKFGGFKADWDMPEVSDMALAQTMRDQYTILSRDLPDPVFRKDRTFCLGTSDGGLWEAAFAAWDFNGDPGYRQCRALITPEAVPTVDPAGLQRIPVARDIIGAVATVVYNIYLALFHLGVNLPGGDRLALFPTTPTLGFMFSPRWWTLVSIAGIAATYQPDDETDLNKLAMRDIFLNISLRVNFPNNWADILLGTNGIDTFRFTNRAFLGELVGNTAVNIPYPPYSVGVLDGGPVVLKEAPLPGNILPNIPILGKYLATITGTTNRVGPTDHTVLYTWRKFNELDGLPYADPSKHFVDIDYFARQVGSPLGWANPYMALKWTVANQIMIWFGARSQDLSGVQHVAEANALPSLTIWSKDSLEGALVSPLFPNNTEFVEGPVHYDIGSAAPVQNNGGPDPYSSRITSYITDLVNTPPGPAQGTGTPPAFGSSDPPNLLPLGVTGSADDGRGSGSGGH